MFKEEVNVHLFIGNQLHLKAATVAKDNMLHNAKDVESDNSFPQLWSTDMIFVTSSTSSASVKKKIGQGKIVQG